MSQIITMRYRGSPALASALVSALEQEGLNVDYVRPEERRGATEFIESTVELTVSGLATTGVIAGSKKAVAAIRARFPGVKVDSPDVDLASSDADDGVSG